MGLIYIVTNDINDMVYIGQTTRTLEIRWSEHIRCAQALTKSKSKLYKGMQEIGIEHFKVDELYKCDNSELDKNEQYYIRQYDSYRNGYNSTPGGVQHKGKTLEPEWLYDMLNDYIDNMSYKELAMKYKVSIPYINRLLGDIKTYNRDTQTSEKHTNKPVLMYDINFENPTYFNSIGAAVRYISKNTEYSISEFNGYTYIVKACAVGNIAYGHRWQLVSNLFYDNKHFRSIFDIEAYKNGNEIIENSYGYYISKHALDKIVIDRANYCKICGKKVAKNAVMCLDCYNKQRESNIPDKETLQSLISQYSYEEIGRQYNVTGKAVRKWCDKYNLAESRNRDSSGVYCVELNIEFSTFKEAAEYLINNNLTRATNVCTLGYRIGQAKKNGKKYQDFHWK